MQESNSKVQASRTQVQSSASSDDLFQDKSLRQVRDKALDHMKWGPLIGSISRLMMAIGGPIVGAGMYGLLGAATPALAAAAPMILAIGLATTILGIAVEYVGTRMYQSASLDQTEVSAQCNARHLVQELKASRMSMTFEQNTRSDGRTWQMATGRGDPEVQRAT